jgi:hypothetical protein
MDVCAEKQSVRHIMLAAFLVWANVSGIEDRKGPFSGHSASMLVDRRYADETPPAQAAVESKLEIRGGAMR